MEPLGLKTLNSQRKIKILFFTNVNTSRIVAQDLNAVDLIAHLDDPFEIYAFNSGNGEINPGEQCEVIQRFAP